MSAVAVFVLKFNYVRVEFIVADYLPDLVGLLKRGHEVVIRGWAILASDDLHISKETILQHLSETEILSLEITPKKSYSATQEYVSIQAHIIRH